MNLYRKFTIAVAITSTAAISLFSSAATAFTITSNSSTQILLEALLGKTYDGLTNFSMDIQGNSEAIGLFENDPFGLNSGIVLSTGRVSEIPGENTKDGGLTQQDGFPNDLSKDFIDSKTPDWISLQISFDADDTARKLFFQYVFGSEEFVEFGGSEFNDLFELELNGTNLAKLSDGQTVTINHLVPDPNGPFHSDYINNPVGSSTPTKLDGFTKMLTFEGLLRQNTRNTLTIKIADVGDGRLDSAVFLKGQSLGTALLPETEKVPEPGLAIASLAVGGLILSKRRKSSYRSRD